MNKLKLLLLSLFAVSAPLSASAQSANDAPPRFVIAVPSPNVCNSADKRKALIFVKNIGIHECIGNTYVQRAGGTGGEATTASTVGTGVSVYKQKVGANLQLRSITAGSNVTVTQGANDITISASGGGGTSVTGGNLASLAGYASFTAAKTAIGAAATTLLVDRRETVTAKIVVPSNIELLTVNGGGFDFSSAGEIEFQGKGLVDPLAATAVFKNFPAGSVYWSSSNAPPSVSLELFDTGNNSLTDRLKIADAALLGKQATLIAYPRTITGTATVTVNHRVFFKDGDYPNVLNTSGTTNQPAFLLQNNTVLQGESWNARLRESPNNGSNYFAYAYHLRYDGGESTLYNENIIIENLSFIGDELQLDTSAGNAFINLGNSRNSEIRNCKFERVHGYAANFGGYGDDGHYAYNSKIRGNTFIGMGSQIANFLNAISCEITDNKFLQDVTNNNSSYAVVDLEPNTQYDRLERIIVARNYFDFTNEVHSQAEYLDLTGAATASGNIGTTITAVGLTGSPLTVNTAVIGGDSSKIVAQKIKNALNANATFKAFGFAYIEANRLKIAKIIGEPNDATFNLAVNGIAGIPAVTTSLDAAKYGSAVLAQSASADRANGIFIIDNIILGRPFDTQNIGSRMFNGIAANGISNLVIKNNFVRGSGGGAYFVRNSANVEISNNSGVLNDDASGLHASLNLTAVANADVRDNLFNVASGVTGIQGTKIIEGESDAQASSTGSTISLVYESNDTVRYLWTGLTVEFNGTTYTVASTNSAANSLTTSVAVGAVAPVTAAATNINAGTDTIAVTNNFQTGGRVALSTTGTLPAHIAPTAYLFSGRIHYYTIRIDADTIKLASSYANALAGAAIDFTNQGTGNLTISPLLKTKFSTNTFTANKAADGILLETGGASVVKDGFNGTVNGVLTVQMAAGQTANPIRVLNSGGLELFTVNSSGNIISSSLTARTGENLNLNPNSNTYVLLNGGAGNPVVVATSRQAILATPAYGVKTPATITENQNDYALDPENGTIQRLSSDASRNITGLNVAYVGNSGGTFFTFINVGTNDIVLKNQDTNSAAGNRIITTTGTDVILSPNQSVNMIYDGTSQRWRAFKVN